MDIWTFDELLNAYFMVYPASHGKPNSSFYITGGLIAFFKAQLTAKINNTPLFDFWRNYFLLSSVVRIWDCFTDNYTV